MAGSAGGGDTRPVSSTVMWINWVGVACMLGAATALRHLPDVPALTATLLTLGSFALPLIVLEAILLRGRRVLSVKGLDDRTSPSGLIGTPVDYGAEGVDWHGSPDSSLTRLGVKLLGLWATLAVIALIYALFPEYGGTLFDPFWAMLSFAMPLFLLGSPAYFWWVDGRMPQPRDGYWHLGALILGWSDHVDLAKVRQHALGWLVKAFFLPLMFVYFHGNLINFRMADFSSLDSTGWHYFFYNLLILVDLGCIVVGYALTMRLFDNHIRSTEPTWSGWLPAIMCYQPFWGLIGPNYFAYRSEMDWGTLLEGYPLLKLAFSIIILGLMAIYTWASVSFGLRFSNLTHRGIITNGPYRWSKHPAYLSKNLSWWFEALPFIAPFVFGFRGQGWHGHWSDALLRTLRLLGVNLIYYIRARTEERHLSHDPAYVRYALWMERHGMMAFVQRLFVFARYMPPRWWLEASERARLESERTGDGTPRQ